MTRTSAPSATHRQMLAGRDEPILDPQLPIIDAHHHLFERGPLRYLVDEYLEDARAGHRIVATVYSETQAFARIDGPEMLRPLGEVEFANGVGAIGASGVYGDCHVCAGIVGHADLRHGAQIAELLDRAMAIAPDRFRGIRQIAIDDPSEVPYRYITHRPPRGILQHPLFRDGIGQVARRDLVFDAAVFHHQMPEIGSLADAFPHLTIVLNHSGQAISMDLDAAGRAALFRTWRELLADLARRPNVFCKVGGYGLPFWGFRFEERTDPIGYRELAQAWKPLVDASIELFGPHRCMMESNYPPDGRSGGFVPIWNALKHCVSGCSAEDKAQLFHRTAARVYRLNLPDRRFGPPAP